MRRRPGECWPTEEKFDIFGNFDPDAHAEEVEERWGDTDAYRESARRAARYGKDDWQRIQQEADDLMARWVAAFDAGISAESQDAMDLAEEHRQQITKHFYECTFDIHVGLAEMYLADERFTRYYDNQRSGLAQYVYDAVMANTVARG